MMLIVAEGNVAQLMGIVVQAQIIVEQVRLLYIYGPLLLPLTPFGSLQVLLGPFRSF